MTEGANHAEERKFNPEDYPALRDFFPAYLHQDFGEEYESAAEAVKGVVGEASGDEIVQVREEWKAFRAGFGGRPLEEIQGALGGLGSAWRPQSEGELEDVDEILSRAEA